MLKPCGLPTPLKMGQPAGFKDSNHLLNSENFSSNHFKSGGLNTPSARANINFKTKMDGLAIGWMDGLAIFLRVYIIL